MISICSPGFDMLVLRSWVSADMDILLAGGQVLDALLRPPQKAAAGKRDDVSTSKWPTGQSD